MTTTPIHLACDAHVSRHLHLSAGALVVAHGGALRLCYRDPTLDEWLGAAPLRSLTLQDGESHGMPRAATVEIHAVRGEAAAIIQSPDARMGDFRAWLRAARAVVSGFALEGRS